jgi:hypothetical protein
VGLAAGAGAGAGSPASTASAASASPAAGAGAAAAGDASGEEELLAFWIAFLKSLSLSANAQTVQFFFSMALPPSPAPGVVSPGRPQQAAPTLHLYTEALRYFAHPDSMVRTSVRTISLKIFQGACLARVRRGLV